jgi:molecular chaperone DnaJ
MRGFDGMEFDVDDIFNQFFGESFGYSRRRSRRGNDLHHEVTITLEDTVEDTTKTITLHRTEQCEHCHGKGGSDVKTCHSCNGRGVRNVTHRTPFGLVQTTTTCSTCEGRGEVLDKECTACRGDGVLSVSKKLDVDIPAGVSDGTRLRLSGQGNAVRGGQTGDLYVSVHVKEHPLFDREDDDLYLDVPITFTQAVLGGEIDVPIIDGKATLKIPKGIKPGTVLRMHDKGIPHLHHIGRGDQNVRITIDVPTKLSKRQKELLEEYETLSEKPHKNLFEKIKDVFE